MTERTDVSTHRDAVNEILNARTDVRHAADSMIAAMDKAERVLIRTASLDSEYFDVLAPMHASAPTPRVAERATDAARIAAKLAADAELAEHARLAERDAVAAESARIAEKMQRYRAELDAFYADAVAACEHGTDCRTCDALPVCFYVAERLSGTPYDKQSATPQQGTPYDSIVKTPPPQRVAPPTVRIPARVPFAGLDATAAVYDGILAALVSDTSMPQVDARHNAHVVVGNPQGIVQIAVTLANVVTIPAGGGKDYEPWGQFVTTTVRPNPNKGSKRANVTYAPLTDSIDYALYLAVPEKVPNTVTPYPMPDAPHLLPHVNAEILGAKVDASDNWRLHMDAGKLIVTFALPSYANIVTVKRSPTWGTCIATTRHAGKRRIAKTVTLGRGLILMLDVILRVNAR